MALVFTYRVCRLDGSEAKTFKSQNKAEEYAYSIKRTEDEKIQITRMGKGFAPYTYYV